MHSEKLLLDLHGLFWWAKRTCRSPNMLRFIGAFQSSFEVLCSVAKAGISSCLISPPTNFNNYMVPHQHSKHVDPPNQTHLKHNILELMHSDFFYLFFYFYLHRLITLIFPLSLKQGPEGQWEIILQQTLLQNRFCGTFLIIQDSSFLLITWWNGLEHHFFLLKLINLWYLCRVKSPLPLEGRLHIW